MESNHRFKLVLERGVRYGVTAVRSSSVEALMDVVRSLDDYGEDEVLILTHRVGQDTNELRTRIERLALNRFDGVAVVATLGVRDTDDALQVSVELRDVLSNPDLTYVVVLSSSEEAELAQALALGGFRDLPTR